MSPRRAAILPAVLSTKAERRVTPWLAAAGVAVLLVGFTLLRFWTRSDLWLDEAQTVAIARMPLVHIPSALRQDGSPPVYYFLLHLWMAVFGTGNLAVRSLSGVCGVACLPLAWTMGSRLGGRSTAWSLLILTTTNAFAVRYSTEARMYTLLILLTLLEWLALTSALARPKWWRLLAVGGTTGALMLTHYWAMYLVAVLIVGLGWKTFRAQPGEERAKRSRVLGAVLGGIVLFAPWIPYFLYQVGHTGTPWTGRADLTDLGLVLGGFGGQGDRLGLLLGVLYASLLVLGLFGVASSGWQVNLDLRVRPLARPLAWTALATLVVALASSEIGDSAFSLRYTAVVFVPIMGLIAMGVGLVDQPWFRRGVLSLVVLLGVLSSYPNVTTNRTQAGEAASAILRFGHRGDVVAYCPDQLGPAMVRLLPSGMFTQVAYPRSGNPAVVDWVDYVEVNKEARPEPFARALVDQAGSGHAVWLVWSPDYATSEGKCADLLNDLGQLRPQNHILFYEDPGRYYEHEELVVYRA